MNVVRIKQNFHSPVRVRRFVSALPLRGTFGDGFSDGPWREHADLIE